MRKIFSLIIILLIVLSLFKLNIPIKAQSDNYLLFQRFYSEEEAINSINIGGDNGGADLLLNPISNFVNDTNIGYYEAKKGRIYTILLNPVPKSVSGKFNPFEYKEIRYAVNFIAERQWFKNVLLKGYAKETFSPINEYDADWVKVADIIEGKNLKDNITLAENIINKTLTNLNIKKINGYWYYNNETIKIKTIFINNDPIRYNYTLHISNILKNLGFEVENINLTSNEARNLVYNSDPKDLKWNLYVEEWNIYENLRYSEFKVAQFYASWYGFMPGWNIQKFWNYLNSTIDDLSAKLLIGDYLDEKERDKILRKIIQMGIEEAVRIFVAQRSEIYVYNKNRVEGIINDHTTGFANKINFLSIKPKINRDKPLVIAYLQKIDDSWNPIGGFLDFSNNLIFNLISDSSYLRNPYNSTLIPWRIKAEVVNSSNKPIFNVDSAIYWDTKEKKWKYVQKDTKVRSIIKFEIIYSKWQDGSEMNLYDILYWFYFLWEWSDKADALDYKYSKYVEAFFKPFISLIKGIKIINETTLIIYSNYYHFDKNELSYIFPPWTSIPWQILLATEELFIEGKTSWYKEEAKELGINWLDLLNSTQSNWISIILSNFKNRSYVPEALYEGVITPISLEEVNKRYSNTIVFIKDYKHALISNGPFKLEKENSILKLSLNKEYIVPIKDLNKIIKDIKINIKDVKLSKALIKGEKQEILINITTNLENLNENYFKLFYIIQHVSGKIAFVSYANFTNGIFKIEFATTNMEAGLWYVKLYCYTIFSSIPSIKSEYFVIIGLAMNNTITNYTTQTQPTLTGIETITSPTTTIGETTTTITPYERPTIDYPTIIIIILLIVIGITAFLIFRKKLFLIF
jgi:peptide/nickel transport system substrate-binding protein